MLCILLNPKLQSGRKGRLQTLQHQSGFTRPIQFACRPRQISRKKHPHMRYNCISRLLFLLSPCQSCERVKWHQKFHNQMQILSHKMPNQYLNRTMLLCCFQENYTHSANLTLHTKTIEVQKPFLFWVKKIYSSTVINLTNFIYFFKMHQLIH